MKRALHVVLALSLALATSGVVALALQPMKASAGVTPGVKPDFDLHPGDTIPLDFSKVMVNSAEARPTNADDCRDDPVISLTCSAHRIKLHRAPGYFLRVSTEWTAVDAAGNSVPDIDTYMFDGPTSQFDYNEVGGVSGAIPEQIKIVDPKQDEYDLVVHQYAGATSGYKVTAEYVNTGSKPAGKVSPDFVLTPHASPVTKSYTSTMVNNPALAFFPDGCRTNPTSDPFCDAYRFKLNRSHAKGAINYVVISLEWDAVDVPGIETPAIGTVPMKEPNLDMYVYDTPDHSLDGVGGTTLTMPERVGFVAIQDEYDLVVQVAEGATTGYKITAFMTDEIFDKPFEVLDPITGNPVGTANPDTVGPFDPFQFEKPPLAPDLALAPVDTDQQIAGIGLGASEQFDNADALALGRAAARNTAAISDPPATWLLVLALIVAPGLLLGAGVVVLRRRHNVSF